ncbi:MAG TPA: head GIN domain-containing protein [Edaphocola sp.]|nr:head GIN domain-containing protein [Edaphocola sp.]
MKNLLSFLMITVILFFTSSCKNSAPDSDTTKTFQVSDFSSLDLGIIGKVIFEQADSFYLNASGSAQLIEDLKISNNNGMLSIELKNKQNYSGEKKELVLRIGAPHLNEINFESVGSLELNNKFQSDALSIKNSGVGKIKIEDCHVGIFNLNSSSVGLVEVKGTANEININSKGIGKIDAEQFKSKRAKVNSSGVGSISVYAEESINISMSGIGNVNYYGNPAEVITNISGIGKATKMEP